MTKTLLIVDDEPLFTRSLSEGLTTLDPSLRVLNADSGLTAKSALESEEVGVVLTDLRMPGMDGFDLLGYMGRAHPLIPVLVMTAFGTPEIQERLHRMGVDEVIEKPVDFASLSERIAQAFLLRERGSRGNIRGRLETFSPFELLQLLSELRKAGVLELARPDGPTASCRFVPGGIAESACGHLTGPEAVLTFLWWKQGTFSFEERSEAPSETECEAARFRVPEFLMNAVRLADETERRRACVPAPDVPLRLAGSHALVEDPVGCDLERVVTALRARPGATAAMLEKELPLAPVKLRLALAVLAEAGGLEGRPTLPTPPLENGSRQRSDWWNRLMRQFPGGLRVLVANSGGESADRVFRAVSLLSETLDLANPSVSFSPIGPSFVRLRPPSGGILSLTFLPLTKKNRYLFETFAESVQAIFVCPENLRLPDWSEWKAHVPDSRAVIVMPEDVSLEDAVSLSLKRLSDAPTLS